MAANLRGMKGRIVALCLVAMLCTAVWGQDAAGSSATATATPPANAAATASRISPPAESHRFPNGVTYIYKAEWKWWDAGEATLRIDRDPSGMQRVTATAKSKGFVGTFFRVNDQFESAFHPRTFCSTFVTKRTEEGRRKRNIEIRFDYQRQKSVLEDTNLRSGEKKKLESDIPTCVTDVLSGLIYAASLRLEPGATHVFPLNDGKTVDLTARVEEREPIKTDAGTFNTIRVQPQAPIGPLKSKGKLWIWYAEDGDRMPVQVRGRMFWGTLTLKLVRIERPEAPTTADDSHSDRRTGLSR
jgi:uncharacterized protein DUF3108